MVQIIVMVMIVFISVKLVEDLNGDILGVYFFSGLGIATFVNLIIVIYQNIIGIVC